MQQIYGRTSIPKYEFNNVAFNVSFPLLINCVFPENLFIKTVLVTAFFYKRVNSVKVFEF